MRIDEVINWFEKFDLDFACLYFDQPDSEGHSYGPDSSEYAEMVISQILAQNSLIKSC